MMTDNGIMVCSLRKCVTFNCNKAKNHDNR